MNTPTEETATLYLLGELEPAERADFEARLRRDPALAARVRALEAEFEGRIRALPQHTPPPDLLARIEARLDAGNSRGTARPRRSGSFSWAAFAQWGLAAVIALGVATIAVQELRRGTAPRVIVVGLGADRSATTELALRGAGATDADARFVQLAELAQKYWNQPSDLPLPSGPAGPARGYAVYDPGSNEGFIGVHQLEKPAGDRRYHLWVVDERTKAARDAGVLPLDGGSGLYSFSLPAAEPAKAGKLTFFVAGEDASAPAQPGTDVVLGSRHF